MIENSNELFAPGHFPRSGFKLAVLSKSLTAEIILGLMCPGWRPHTHVQQCAVGVSWRLHSLALKSFRIAFNVGLIIIEDCIQRIDQNLDW